MKKWLSTGDMDFVLSGRLAKNVNPALAGCYELLTRERSTIYSAGRYLSGAAMMRSTKSATIHPSSVDRRDRRHGRNRGRSSIVHVLVYRAPLVDWLKTTIRPSPFRRAEINTAQPTLLWQSRGIRCRC